MPLVMCERQTSSWLFPDFPGDFFLPLHSACMAFKLILHGLRSLKKKKYQSSLKCLIGAYLAALRCFFCWMPGGAVQLFLMSDLFIVPAALSLHSFMKMLCRCTARRINMDYLLALGKISASKWIQFSLKWRLHVNFDSFLFSLVM